MQKLLVLQALWSMQRAQPDGVERSLEENVEMIAGAGFDGLGSIWTEREQARRVSALTRPRGLAIEGMCFAASVDELKPVLDIATEFPVHHIDIQPNVRLRTVEGMKVAKARGRLRGKQPKLSRKQEAHLVSLVHSGEYSTLEVAELFGVGPSTVYRAIERQRL